MKVVKTNLPVNYITVKATKSRIDKGLLAIPVSLLNIFPNKKGKILVSDSNDEYKEKNFTPYQSSSRECRIGGMKQFYKQNHIQAGEEIVIIKRDANKFQFFKEKDFAYKIIAHLTDFENEERGNVAEETLRKIVEITSTSKKELLQYQFVKQSSQKTPNRQRKTISKQTVKESVPASMRRILLEMYKGKCQISNFTFLMKNGKPYFEIHHIHPDLGNHFKNLLVVSPNIHTQFTYAPLKQEFDKDGWLRSVSFNGLQHPVFQIIDNIPLEFFKQIHT